MLRSAWRSRSMVVTPGLTMLATSSRTWRTMRPLRRILSISDGDLQTTAIRRSQPHRSHQARLGLAGGPFAAPRIEHGKDRACHVLRIGVAIDHLHLPASSKVFG